MSLLMSKMESTDHKQLTREVGVQVKTATVISLQKKATTLTSETQTPNLATDDTYEAALLRGHPLPVQRQYKFYMNDCFRQRSFQSISDRFRQLANEDDECDVVIGAEPSAIRNVLQPKKAVKPNPKTAKVAPTVGGKPVTKPSTSPSSVSVPNASGSAEPTESIQQLTSESQLVESRNQNTKPQTVSPQSTDAAETDSSAPADTPASPDPSSTSEDLSELAGSTDSEDNDTSVTVPPLTFRTQIHHDSDMDISETEGSQSSIKASAASAASPVPEASNAINVRLTKLNYGNISQSNIKPSSSQGPEASYIIDDRIAKSNPENISHTVPRRASRFSSTTTPSTSAISTSIPQTTEVRSANPHTQKLKSTSNKSSMSREINVHTSSTKAPVSINKKTCKPDRTKSAGFTGKGAVGDKSKKIIKKYSIKVVPLSRNTNGGPGENRTPISVVSELHAKSTAIPEPRNSNPSTSSNPDVTDMNNPGEGNSQLQQAEISADLSGVVGTLTRRASSCAETDCAHASSALEAKNERRVVGSSAPGASGFKRKKSERFNQNASKKAKFQNSRPGEFEIRSGKFSKITKKNKVKELYLAGLKNKVKYTGPCFGPGVQVHVEKFQNMLNHYNLGMGCNGRWMSLAEMKEFMGSKKSMNVAILTSNGDMLSQEEVVTAFTVCDTVRLGMATSFYIRDRLGIEARVWELQRNKILSNKGLYYKSKAVIEKRCGIFGLPN